MLYTGPQSPPIRPKPIFLSSSKLVDIWYARVSDEPETLVQTGKPEMLLRDETQLAVRFGNWKLVLADFDSRRRLHCLLDRSFIWSVAGSDVLEKLVKTKSFGMLSNDESQLAVWFGIVGIYFRA